MIVTGTARAVIDVAFFDAPSSPLLPEHGIKQPLTPLQHILPSGLEIVGVPRVRDIAGVRGVVHQEGHLPGIIAAANAIHILEVGAVHANQQIIFVVVLIGELPRSMTVAGDAMLHQLAACGQIDRIADLLPTGGSRRDLKFFLQARFLHQVLHHELGHRASADIAVANEQYFYHRLISPYKSCISSQRPNIAEVFGIFMFLRFRDIWKCQEMCSRGTPKI